MNIKDKIYVSTGAFKSRNLAEILDIAASNNITNIEISSGLAYSDEPIKLLRGYKNKLKFLIHNYFPPYKENFLLNLSSSNEENIKKTLNLCNTAIDCCSELGSEFYSVHCGFAFDSDGSYLGDPRQMSLKRISLEGTKKIFVENVRALAEYAKQNGVKLAIENNCLPKYALVNGRNETCLGTTKLELRELIDKVDSSNLYILFDLGHNKVNSNSLGTDAADIIDEFKNELIAYHLSENDGLTDNNIKITRDSEFIKHPEWLKNKYSILEVYNLNPEEILEQISILAEGAV